jgi:hypothetical protein
VRSELSYVQKTKLCSLTQGTCNVGHLIELVGYGFFPIMFGINAFTYSVNVIHEDSLCLRVRVGVLTFTMFFSLLHHWNGMEWNEGRRCHPISRLIN